MNRKGLALGIATAVAAGVLSTSAFASSVFGTNSQKGSLVIFPRIVAEANGSADTIVTLTNDSTSGVLLKCFYATSDPWNGTGSTKPLKHFQDFTINLTHNQPVAWLASSGQAYSGSQRWQGFVVPPFGYYPDGTFRPHGELKCWVIMDDFSSQKSWNHLFGTASVIQAGGQAYEYSAWGFQALYATGTASATPGVLNLNNSDYDACPNMLLGNFIASDGTAGGPQTTVTLASCNEDLRQNFTPTVTKLTWTFYNQDEGQRTGFHICADSWFEYVFPTTITAYTGAIGLGTIPGYFRIETTADTSICAGATTSAYVGVENQSFGAGFFRGTNLTGRGPASGIIRYDIGPPDSFRPSN